MREDFSVFQGLDSYKMSLASLRLRIIFIGLIITVRERTKWYQVTYYKMLMNSDADSFVPKTQNCTMNILHVEISLYALTLTQQPCRALPSHGNF